MAMPPSAQISPAAKKAAFYRTIWRWHFYAGVLVVPMVLILSLTGAAYLFKPQIERWEERAWQGLPTAGAATPEAQVSAALAALPGAKFHSYRLPQQQGDAAMIHVGLAGAGDGKAKAMRDVFVSPQGQVVGVLDPEWRIMEIAHDTHGQLLLGKRGSWLVELAASWAIVMILTGLYLWWPRGRGVAGVLWPRLSAGSRTAWRDMHAVTGFWVSGLAMVLLLTGLPWADVWGSAFKAVRAEMGWVKGKQDWTIGGAAPASDEHAQHAQHDHAAMMAMNGHMPGMDHGSAKDQTRTTPAITLSEVVRRAQLERLAFPAVVTPPGASGRFGRKGGDTWTMRSDSQNRPLRTTITLDKQTGRELSRESFADGHPIDRVVGYGVAWHEGQLFGWVNQLIGVLTALMLATLSVSGFVMWRKRKPDQGLGAPPMPNEKVLGKLVPVLLILAALLPLLALSLVVVALLEKLLLPRTPNLAIWLGLQNHVEQT
jgi:uncharacterized iron-regulated membrane protein